MATGPAFAGSQKTYELTPEMAFGDINNDKISSFDIAVFQETSNI